MILSMLNIRVCPFYFVFKKPCPACGLTRAFIELSKFNISKSLEYNILAIPILLFFLVYLIFVVFKKEDLVSDFLNKHKLPIIIFAVLLLIFVLFRNLNNPLLY